MTGEAHEGRRARGVALGAVVGGVLGAVAGAALGAWAATALLHRPGAGVVAPAPLAGLDELRARLDALEHALAARPVAPVVRREPASSHLPAVEVAPRAGTAAAGDGPFDPRRLLAEYVASFEGGGEGSEFFRMAVAAYAWPLRGELHAIARDERAPEALRLAVIAMLDGGSFRGDGDTIDALLELVRAGGFEAGELRALEILARIGDRQTALLIEALASGLQPLAVRAAAWDALAALCGADVESVLLRLLEREGDPAAQELLLQRFAGRDRRATLRAFQIASRLGDRAPRLTAAGQIGGHPAAEFVAFATEWHGREGDEEVRERLAAAIEEQRTVPGCHELQALGPPDVADLAADDPRAWAPATMDGGREWLELEFPPVERAWRVTVHETCAAGGIVEVAVASGDGPLRAVWSGRAGARKAGPRDFDFAPSGEPVTRVRITVDTAAVSGWNEIDAVWLEGGRDGAFAAGAQASSSYGRRSARRTVADIATWFDGLRIK